MYKNSKHTVLFPLLLAAGVVLGLLLGQYMGRNSTTSEIKGMLRQMALPTNKLTYTLSLIENQYVDSVAMDSLAEHVIPLLVKELDPHSVYIPASEMQEINEPLEGEFDGIGVVFNMATDTVIVLNVIPQGPSDKAGVKAGDRIIEVNDTVIAGVKMNTDEVMRRLRGPKGSTVTVKVLRAGVKELLPFTIKRDKIPVYSLDASYMVEGKIGYIRVNRFAATTGQEFTDALHKLQKQGMKDLILDLQGNGGGYLNAAISLCDQILGKKELIVYTEGRRNPRSEFEAKGDGDFQKGRLVVLVDEFSASASEIVSGAVQDWDRGIIVGRRSFGKGLVQRPIDLPDGSMIRLTIARYYTPAGRCIQKPYDSSTDYNKDLIERFNHGELMNADSIHFPDSLKVQTKKRGRTVYGGGGIMPDYIVPIDTTLYTDYHRNLVAKGAVIKFTMKFIEGHRKELANKYKKFESFNEKFIIDDDMLATLREMGEKEGVKFNEEQYQKSLPLIKTQLKALIARDLWDMNEYFRVMNTTNESVQKALEILNSEEYQKKLRAN